MTYTYRQALEYLYSFTDYEVAPAIRYSPDVIDPTRPARLLASLGDPQSAYPTIHIAGTKGKGSVAAICASVLRAAGLRTGLYTSPHLRSFSERIQVDGQHIPEDVLAELVFEIRPALAQLPDITAFEVITALAFLYFSRQGVEAAVIEVGLGGRLDATNVICPLVSAITSLSYDHTFLLGDTLGEIAAEKGGIIKQGVPVVSAPQDREALAVLAELADERGAPLTVVGSRAVSGRDWWYEPLEMTLDGQSFRSGQFGRQGKSFRSPLLGSHQVINATVALAVLDLVREEFPSLDDAAIRQGIADVQWPGRFQILSQHPTVVVDGAHNVDSAKRLRDTLETLFPGRRCILVVGISTGKDTVGIIEVLAPVADHVVVTAADHPRVTGTDELHQQFERRHPSVTLAPTVALALEQAWEMAGPDDVICGTGSLFVVGDMLTAWEARME